MNYLQYLQEGKTIYKSTPLQRLVTRQLIPEYEDSQITTIDWSGLKDYVKRLASMFKKDSDPIIKVDSSNMYVDENGIARVGDPRNKRPIDYSNYILVSNGNNGVIYVPKPGS